MTEQEAAALLRSMTVTTRSLLLTREERLAIADLLDPPREGLAKVQIALAWSEDGDFSAVPFGPRTWNPTLKDAEGSLAEQDHYIGLTVISAWLTPPNREPAQVEGEVEG